MAASGAGEVLVPDAAVAFAALNGVAQRTQAGKHYKGQQQFFHDLACDWGMNHCPKGGAQNDYRSLTRMKKGCTGQPFDESAGIY